MRTRSAASFDAWGCSARSPFVAPASSPALAEVFLLTQLYSRGAADACDACHRLEKICPHVEGIGYTPRELATGIYRSRRQLGAAGLKNVKGVILGGCAHWIYEENAEETLPVIIDFLASTKEAGRT